MFLLLILFMMAGTTAVQFDGALANIVLASTTPSHPQNFAQTSEAEEAEEAEAQSEALDDLYRDNGCHRCDLSNQLFDNLDLINVTLKWSTLSDSSFRNTDLVMANISYANVQRSNFERADLSLAVLEGADLSYARFINANLEGANLTSAIFTRTNFMNANLRNAEIDLEEAMGNGAFFCGATLPDGTLGACH
ncbi:MAG: pentapeptide repeat-containing protein [Cyanobacteria bacterium P01_F01_bin.150]